MPATVQDADIHVEDVIPNPFGSDTGRVIYRLFNVVCPNDACCKTMLKIDMFDRTVVKGEWVAGEVVKRSWRLMPRSMARQYDDYVPQAIREDYEEASLILNDSPKAAATLARRALQGIMRDFFCVKPGNLKDEIDAAETSGKMDSGIVAALHAVRDVGNIGAHMEKDIDLIVPVDPGEAETLLRLIELLIDETYVARNERAGRISSVLKVAEEKKAAKAVKPGAESPS